MKRAFTLIEMMVVVAILVTLMTIAFRLSNMGKDSESRTRTVVRLQRLENCLSGYMAAFGSYPPVKLHGSRDIYAKTEGDVQDRNGGRNESIWGWTAIGQEAEKAAWGQVRAACRAQPVDCRYPFEERYNDLIRDVSEQMKEYAHSECWDDLSEDQKKKIDGGFTSICENPGRLNSSRGELDWNDIQLFKFGLMSFLLPRYIIMTSGPQEFYTQYAQWTGNNVLPSDPFGGNQFTDWTDVWSRSDKARQGQSRELARLANIPSQAACARWIPNLENACACNGDRLVLFGVDVKSHVGNESNYLNYRNLDIEVYHPKSMSVGQQQYILDGVSVLDGWGSEFYYYSPAPYQRYTIWSAGPNGRTFPVWISRGDLSSAANRCVGLWTEDDIIHLSH